MQLRALKGFQLTKPTTALLDWSEGDLSTVARASLPKKETNLYIRQVDRINTA